VEATTLVSRSADSAGDARQLTKGVFGIVSPDGRNLVFVTDERGHGRLHRASLSADGTTGSVQPMFPENGDPDVRDLAVSPNGRVLAFEARQADRTVSIFLTEFPSGEGRWLVAQNGRHPQFSADGRQLYYVRSGADPRGEPTAFLMSVDIGADPSLKIGVATELFQQNDSTGPLITSFGVAPDGKRFLMMKPATLSPGDENRTVLVQNWPAAMTR
jgi:Tol biopolymer transport system component